MLRTISFFFIFWVVLFISTVLLIPYYILTLSVKSIHLKNILYKIVSFWGRFTLWTARAKVNRNGVENIPKNKNVAFVGNHQGNMDIPIMLSYSPLRVGFLAKKELEKIPFISQWMNILGCVFIDRKKLRSAIDAFDQTIMRLNSQSMIIFPEGTRSQCSTMNPFKEGLIKLLIQNKITIVPFTICNSYKLYEEHKNIKGAKVTLTFHEKFEFDENKEYNTKEIVQELWTITNDSILTNQEKP